MKSHITLYHSNPPAPTEFNQPSYAFTYSIPFSLFVNYGVPQSSESELEHLGEEELLFTILSTYWMWTGESDWNYTLFLWTLFKGSLYYPFGEIQHFYKVECLKCL